MSHSHTHCGSPLSRPAPHTVHALRRPPVPLLTLLAKSVRSRGALRDSTVPRHFALRLGLVIRHAAPWAFVHSVLSSSPSGVLLLRFGLIVLTIRLPIPEVIPVYSLSSY